MDGVGGLLPKLCPCCQVGAKFVGIFAIFANLFYEILFDNLNKDNTR